VTRHSAEPNGATVGAILGAIANSSLRAAMFTRQLLVMITDERRAPPVEAAIDRPTMAGTLSVTVLVSVVRVLLQYERGRRSKREQILRDEIRRDEIRRDEILREYETYRVALESVVPPNRRASLPLFRRWVWGLAVVALSLLVVYGVLQRHWIQTALSLLSVFSFLIVDKLRVDQAERDDSPLPAFIGDIYAQALERSDLNPDQAGRIST